MRGAPQVGFSATMRKINFRTSPDSLFLPTCFLTFEIKLQYSRNPARCQRTTVSGVTTRRDLFQSVQNRHASTQKSLSKGLSFGLPAYASVLRVAGEAPDSPEVGCDANESNGPPLPN